LKSGPHNWKLYGFSKLRVRNRAELADLPIGLTQREFRLAIMDERSLNFMGRREKQRERI